MQEQKTRYVEVSQINLETFLQSLDFSRIINKEEIVYQKAHLKNNNLKIKIYTSLSEKSKVVRACGQDAIRIAVVLDTKNKSYGLASFQKVYRTGSEEKVFERIKLRVFEAYEFCCKWLEKNSNNSNHYGKIGDNVKLTLSVKKRCGPYNNKFLFILNDDKNNIFTYWTEKNLLQLGETYDLKAIIKSHNSFNNQKQTELFNCIGKRVVM